MKKVKMITRDVLRDMSDGDTISMLCKDGYEMDSKKQLAYAFQRNENCKFSCRTDGMVLNITRTNC